METITEIKLIDINYDVSLPFVLNLEGIAGNDTQIKCNELLRLIPGKRLVCRAEWQGKAVVIKVFIGQPRFSDGMTREKEGVKALMEKAITAPALLYSGTLKNNDASILIYEYIPNAINAHNAWQSATTENKFILLRNFMVLLVQHHEAGLSQQDMHLSNFIFADDKLYTLDAADILAISSPLNMPASIENLALFFSLFHKSYNQLIEKAYNEYINLRTWPHRDGAIQELLLRVEALRQHKKNKYLRKIFRECSEFICDKSFRKNIVYDRCYDTRQFRGLLDNPEICFNKGDSNVIKPGNTCTVATCNIDDNTIVVKRYNTKNFFHGCKRIFSKTRAMKSWINAHRLIIANINCARPIAFIENRFDIFHGKSYFIMQHITGMNCYDYFLSDNIKMDDKKIMAPKIAGLFEQLASHQLSHSDMKATNIFIHDNQPVLLGLDGMREHNSDASLKRAITKDIKRFLANWEGSEKLLRLFRFSLDKTIRELQLPVA